MREKLEMAGLIVLGVFAVAVVALLMIGVMLFYGAVWGALGAGVYLAFKWLVALVGM